MLSVVPGFEYDIFISYRQKDNRADHWVTEFVNALRSELDATFKEDISIYFDGNPHDGLLGTHDVDDSLKGKLKCLIFIPIISQTYCDPKSFAWTNEFLAFKKLANEDQFGLKLKLQNGNVASRILPLRIHELDPSDKSVLENEIGPLRSVDFIFRSQGVNRPLSSREEHPHDNQNKTFYRDQVNKVANAIKELIGALHERQIKGNQQLPPETPVSSKGRKKLAVIAAGLLLVGIALFSFFYFGGIKEKAPEQTNSIAVLPFDNLSNDPDQDYFCDGTTEQVISSLARLKDLRVMARTSVQQYKKTTKTIAQIGKELNVTHILESSVRKSGNQIRITAQLIAVQDESHLWAEDFDNKVVADIFQIQDAVATKIAASLKSKLLPEEKEKLKTEKPSSPEAYEHYLKGEYMHGVYFGKFLNDDFLRAEAEFKGAIQLDSNYATAWAALANLYDTRSNVALSNDEKKEFRKLGTKMASEAYRLNPTLPYSLIVQYESWTHRDNLEPELDSAFNYAAKAYEAAPNSLLISTELGWFYSGIGLYNHAIRLFKYAREIAPTGPTRSAILGYGYYYLGDLEAAKKMAEMSLAIDPKSFIASTLLLMIYSDQKNFIDAGEQLEKLKKLNPERDFSSLEARILAEKGEKKEIALRKFKEERLFFSQAQVFVFLKMKKEALDEMEKRPLNYLEYKNSHFDFLRGDPRFEKIIDKAKVLYEERLKKYGNIDLPK